MQLSSEQERFSPPDALIRKWAGTVIDSPIIAAVIAGIRKLIQGDTMDIRNGGHLMLARGVEEECWCVQKISNPHNLKKLLRSCILFS